MACANNPDLSLSSVSGIQSASRVRVESSVKTREKRQVKCRAYRRRPCGYLKDLRTPSVVSCDSGHGVRNAIYLINPKILLTKPHSGIAVLMLSYLLPIRWQGHAVVSAQQTGVMMCGIALCCVA